MSRYYPGFLAALFIVLLRIAIGWHFLHEGLEKVGATLEGKHPFSAEVYLRNANGPVAPIFRKLLPDSDGLALLDPARLKAAWKEDVARIAGHFVFTQEQRSEAQKILDENLQWVDYWFDDPENSEKVQKYIHDIRLVEQTERNLHALSFQKERAWDARRGLDADRRSLSQPLLDRLKTLRDAVTKLATPEQLKSSGDPGAPWTSLDIINELTMLGLVAIGACLIAGFLTTPAALGAAAFLAMIYLAMPPLPGLPPNPKAEGNYLIVSKNLVELLACMVIATTPNGHWVGFDALFFGRRGAGGSRAAQHREQQARRDGHYREGERRPIPVG